MPTTPRPRHTRAPRTVLVTAALLLGLATAQADPSGLRVAASAAGQHLTDAAGFSLYLFWPDALGGSTCIDSCALAWPPFIVASAGALPTVTEDLAPDLLGFVTRSDGSLHLTFNGWPLYYYVGDALPGDTYGHMATEDWYLVTPVGSPLGLGTGD